MRPFRWFARGLRRGWTRLQVATGDRLGRVLARVINLWEVGRPVYTDADRATIAEEGYKRSSLIQACVSEFATSIAEPPLVADRDGERLPADDPLGQIADSPNHEITSYDYTERLGTDLKVYGEAIVHLLRSRAGMIRELWPLRVDKVEVIPQANGEIHHYEQAGTPEIKPADIMHIKFPNPLSDYRGLSPIFVLLPEGQLDKDAILYLGEFFRNGGLPRAVLTSEQELNDNDRREIRKEIRETTGRRGGRAGSTGWHGELILGKGAKLESFGVDPSQLDMAPIFDLTESRVCAVMGVPAILVNVRIGLLQAQAYGTAREARRGWWGETLSPFAERLSQLHTLKIAREFGPAYRLRYDLSEVGALKEAQSQVIRDAVLAFKNNLLSRDQALEHMGKPPIDGEAVYSWELMAQQMAAQQQRPADGEASRPWPMANTTGELVGLKS